MIDMKAFWNRTYEHLVSDPMGSFFLFGVEPNLAISITRF